MGPTKPTRLYTCPDPIGGYPVPKTTLFLSKEGLYRQGVMMRPGGWALSMMAAMCVLVGTMAGCPEPKPVAATCERVTEGWGPKGSVSFKVEKVATGLTVPWGVVFLPNGGILISERPGRVRLVREGQLDPTPVLEVQVSAQGEGGLLGLALHPQFRFTTNPTFYAYFTVDKEGKAVNRVVRYKLNATGTKATQDKIILDDIPSARFHNGGRLRFGPDGMLYIGTGDARDPNLSQQRESMAGKILRVTPEGEIPVDNPWQGNPAYMIGLRNTQGFDWWKDGYMVVTDHGPSGDLGRSDHDEFTFAKAGSDLGWPTIHRCEAQEGQLTPALTWAKAAPPGGAALYTGDAIPEWKGSLLIGTLGSKHLHRIAFADDGSAAIKLHEVYLEGDAPTGYGRLREVIMGPDKQLYVTTSNCDGRGSCPSDGDYLLRLTR